MAALAVAGIWLAAAASPVAAQSSGHVRLEIAGCPTISTQDVRRVLSVELGDLLLEPGAPDAREADGLLVRCAGNVAFVEATGGGEPPIERIFPLDDFPGDAAPRALALLGVELLAARSAAVRQRIMRRQSGPAASVVQTPVVPPAALAPVPAERDVRVGVAGVWRTFVTSGGASAFGGRVEASSTALKVALASADLEMAGGRRDVDGVGQTSAWLISGGATFGTFAANRRWRAAVGLGGRIGLLRESGRSADPLRVVSSTFVRPWGGPMLTAGLSGRVGHLAVSAGGEIGWSLSSVDELAANATSIAVGGPWVAACLGVDWRR